MIQWKAICCGLELKPWKVYATRKNITPVTDEALVEFFSVEKGNFDTGIAEKFCEFQHDMA